MSGGQFCWLRCVFASTAGEEARPQRTETPAASATACRWRAWLSHLLFPRNRRVYRRERKKVRGTAAASPCTTRQHVTDTPSGCPCLLQQLPAASDHDSCGTRGREQEDRVRWEWEAGTYESGCNLRGRVSLQVHAGSICALLTHLKNESHMESDSNLF